MTISNKFKYRLSLYRFKMTHLCLETKCRQRLKNNKKNYQSLTNTHLKKSKKFT